MKKIGLITTNKVLAQSLAKATQMQPEWPLDFYLLLNLEQASLDVEVLRIEVALIDVMSGDVAERSAVIAFCENLRQVVPSCRLLLLVSQDDKAGCKMAIEAVKSHRVDDFVFYDASLEYLMAKLSAI